MKDLVISIVLFYVLLNKTDNWKLFRSESLVGLLSDNVVNNFSENVINTSPFNQVSVSSKF